MAIRRPGTERAGFSSPARGRRASVQAIASTDVRSASLPEPRSARTSLRCGQRYALDLASVQPTSRLCVIYSVGCAAMVTDRVAVRPRTPDGIGGVRVAIGKGVISFLSQLAPRDSSARCCGRRTPRSSPMPRQQGAGGARCQPTQISAPGWFRALRVGKDDARSSA